MASESLLPPKWVLSPPSQFDIVACYFPETKPKAELRLRPCLVEKVLQGRTSGNYAVEVVFGTKNLKSATRRGLDLIIQNSDHLDEMGLPVATRFDLDREHVRRLPWNSKFFGCWGGYSSPIISALTEGYQKEYAYCRMVRMRG